MGLIVGPAIVCGVAYSANVTIARGALSTTSITDITRIQMLLVGLNGHEQSQGARVQVYSREAATHREHPSIHDDFDGNTVINVKDGPYNARGDGSDDSESVFKAWRAAQKGDGHPCRNLYFPSGTYYLPAFHQVHVTTAYQGCQWLGDGAGPSGNASGASVLRFDYHPARASLIALREHGSRVTATTARPHGFTTGEDAFILTPVDAHYNAVHKVTVLDSTHFTYEATRAKKYLARCDSSCGDASDALVLILDGASHLGFQNLTIQGAINAPFSGIFVAGFTDDAVTVASCCNLFFNVSTPGWRYFFASTSDLDGTTFVHLDGVGGGCFYSYWDQSNLINFVGSNLNCYDNSNVGAMDYDFTGPGFTLLGGYVASAIRGDSPTYSVHYLRTFGGGSPLAAYGTHWEPYGNGGKIVKDDSLDASKVIHLENDSIGGDSTGTLIQITDKSQVDLINISSMTPGQVELDTNRNAGQAKIWAPGLHWVGQTDGSLPVMNTCDRTTPPSNCREVLLGDPTQPTYLIEGQRRYGVPTAIGEQFVFGGPAPTLSSCGTRPNPAVLMPSTNLGFRFTSGGGARSCIVSFFGSFPNTPSVTCSDESRAAGLRVLPGVSQVTVSGFKAGDTIDCNVTPH